MKRCRTKMKTIWNLMFAILTIAVLCTGCSQPADVENSDWNTDDTDSVVWDMDDTEALDDGDANQAMDDYDSSDAGLAADDTWENENDISYEFRKEEYLEEHFEKHGDEFDYASAEEYLEGACRVINDENALHKTEAEDGDDVYYLESTNEFVVVSTDGYIRTYFKPNDGIDYFNRQQFATTQSHAALYRIVTVGL